MEVRLKNLTEVDLDRSIFRYYSLWFFERAMKVNNLDLVTVHNWADPMELTPWQMGITDPGTGQQKFSETIMRPVYGQCWSQAEESDTLMRAYSRVEYDRLHQRNVWPKEEGVVVRTTPQKLIEAIEGSTQTFSKDHFMIGSVDYVTEDEYRDLVRAWMSKFKSSSPDVLWGAVDLLFSKRKAFRHEEELRVVYVDPHGQGVQPVVSISCKIGNLFTGIEFDPRLATFERNEREEWAQKVLGYTGTIDRSTLYDRVIFEG